MTDRKLECADTSAFLFDATCRRTPNQDVNSDCIFRSSDQLFANPSAMAIALRMAMDLLTVS